MMNKLSVGILAISLAITTSGCFTGIESTPKISSKDVKKQHLTESPEQQFVAALKPQPFDRWKPGKSFLITDDRITVAFDPTANRLSELKGLTLTYQGRDTIQGVDGVRSVALDFTLPSGQPMRYRTGNTSAQLSARQSVDIPFTIDMELVAEARDMLVTRRVYTLTRSWLTTDRQPMDGRKFVGVEIVGVEPGNSDYPLLVTFVDGTGVTASMYMTVGDSRQSTRNFDTLFSFKDPRLNYPSINDEAWTNIVAGKVEQGMTRDECRLALGAPDEIDRIPGYGGVAERWVYTDGSYLVFDNGVLERFRR